jgi:tetratricopeptide (TPR) repeat protein
MLIQITLKRNTSACLYAFFFACILAIMLFPSSSIAQDKIYKTDSTIIESKVQEVGTTEIKYKKFSNLDGPVYSIKKENVKMIVYANGEKELYNQSVLKQQAIIPLNTPPFDSLAYIEQFFGVKLQSELGGGVKIIDKLPGHRLRRGVSAGEAIIGVFTCYIGFAVMGISGEFSLKGGLITDIGIRNVGETQWNWIRITNTSDLTKTLFEIRKNSDKYDNVASVKIKKSLGTTKGSVNISELDLAPIENSSKEKARNFILSENINDAIAAYAQLIKNDSTNANLLAEDAYALALGGIYDAALMRLDCIWSIGVNSPDANYFTAQVFALMGYNDLANEFWKESDKNKTPEWISNKAKILLQKFKCKSPNPSTAKSEELIANFKRANDLASKKLYLQSIALFQKVINLCPNEYLPYVGYSIALEKTGALEKSQQSIEKAISLIGTTTEDQDKKQYLEHRLAAIKGKIATIPIGIMPGFPQRIVPDVKQPQMMAYFGGSLGHSTSSLNGRIGYYISESSNASFDLGTMKSSGSAYTNLGLSVYNRQHNFVSGGGLLLSSSNSTTTLFLKLSIGFSKMNISRTSSIDIFLDVNEGLGKTALKTFGLSIGKSIYFGKRK